MLFRSGISDPNIHNYCKNVSADNMVKRHNVALDESTDMNGIKSWALGDKFYGVLLEPISTGNFGMVQNKGIILMDTDGGITFNDEVELNSMGLIIKRTTGTLIGYARESISASGTIKIKLATE